MNVFFYIPATNEDDEWIQRAAEMVAPKAETEVFRSIGDLSRRLCSPAYGGPTVAVLLAGNKKDLLNMVSIRHLLFDIPIILILSDRGEDTTAMGYTLYPRFLTYADSNLMEVGAVLEKMIKYYDEKNVMEEQEIDARLGATRF